TQSFVRPHLLPRRPSWQPPSTSPAPPPRLALPASGAHGHSSQSTHRKPGDASAPAGIAAGRFLGVSLFARSTRHTFFLRRSPGRSSVHRHRRIKRLIRNARCSPGGLAPPLPPPLPFSWQELQALYGTTLCCPIAN